MALSQADFYAYSRATGAPVPEDSGERAEMAPEVLAFRRNQLKTPEKQGADPLSVGIGVGLALAGGVGAALGARRLMRGPKQSATAGVRQANLAEMAGAESPVRRVVTETTSQPSKVTTEIVNEPEYVSPYRKGPTYQDLYPSRFAYPSISTEALQTRRQASAASAEAVRQLTPSTYQLELGGEASPTLRQIRSSEFGPNLTPARREALGLAEETTTSPEFSFVRSSIPLVDAPNQLNLFKQQAEGVDVAQNLINEFLENERREVGRQQKIKQDIAMQKEGMAMRIVDELRKEAKEEVKGFSPRSYLEQKGSLAPVQDLTSTQQQSLPQIIDQNLNAVESGEDQMTGRIKQQLQRNEDLDLTQVELMEEVADANYLAGMEQDEPINQVASRLPDGLPVDQAERMRAFSSQELADLARDEMISRRQELVNRGLRPGTTRFENALAQSWATKPGFMPGTEEFRQRIALPRVIRNAVQAASADPNDPLGGLKERTVVNIGPNAEIESTAAGTAIRGASPSYYEAFPKTEERQLLGTKDPLVTGIPLEMGQDIAGRAISSTAISADVPESQLSKQEIKYAALNKPPTEGPVGGLAGIGVYGIQPSFVPGAVGKASGQYSAAASQQPTHVPGWLQKEAGQFSGISSEGLTRALEKSGKTGIAAINKELARRKAAKESLAVSEVLRRARIEGRDPQSILRQFGIGN